MRKSIVGIYVGYIILIQNDSYAAVQFNRMMQPYLWVSGVRQGSSFNLWPDRGMSSVEFPRSTMVNNLLTFKPMFCYKYIVKESKALPVFELRTAHHSKEADAV